MSRIGKKPIIVPAGVQVTLNGQHVAVKGPKGQLSLDLHGEIRAELKDGLVTVAPLGQGKQSMALWGLSRQLIANMVSGVSEGFSKQLELEGVGYKAGLQGENLILDVGFSHTVEIIPEPGIKFQVQKNVITISGIDKQLVGNTAAKIRKVRKVEPYKGKGIKYVGEYVRRKAGKKAVGAA